MPLPALATAPGGVDADVWEGACEFARTYCGWHVAPSVTEAITLDGPGGSILHLPTMHVTALDSITSDGYAVASPEWSAGGMVRGSWSSRFRGITVTLTHGHPLCPAEVLTVLSGLVESTGRGGVSQVSSGAHQVSYESAMSADQRAILDAYRLPPLP